MTATTRTAIRGCNTTWVDFASMPYTFGLGRDKSLYLLATSERTFGVVRRRSIGNDREASSGERWRRTAGRAPLGTAHQIGGVLSCGFTSFLQ